MARIETYSDGYDVLWRDGDRIHHRRTFATAVEAATFRAALDGGIGVEAALNVVEAARETARPAQEPAADPTQMRFSG